MRYVVGGKKTKRFLPLSFVLSDSPLEDHRGIECYLFFAPSRTSLRAHSAGGETVKSIQCFVLSDAKRV